MQTFVLAPQSPKKYYVHNDIFRYQDEVRISIFFLNLLELHVEGFSRTYIVHYSSIFIHIYLLSSAPRFSMRGKKVLEPLLCLWTPPKLSPRRSRFFIFS